MVWNGCLVTKVSYVLIPPLNTTVPAVYVYGGLRRMGNRDLDSYVHTMFTEAVLAVVMLPGCLPTIGGKGGPSTHMLTVECCSHFKVEEILTC